MAKAGRPSVPAKIKELSGTVRKDRSREGVEFEKLTIVPKPEVWMDNRAKKYFKNICELLIGKDMLTVANVQLVVIMAQEYATYEEATRELKESGKVFESDKGNLLQSPWVSIRNNAQKNYRDIAGLFGLDPISSQKIGSTSKGTTDDFEKLNKKYDNQTN
jgi:P27 family predicted phage terminase small subunit